MVSRDDIVARVPQLRSDDILGGSFCPTDGFVDPYSVMTGLYDLRVERRGDACGVRPKSPPSFATRDGVLGVETAAWTGCYQSRVQRRRGVAARVAALVGIDLPVRTPSPNWCRPNRLTTCLARHSHGHRHANGFHFRPGEPGLSAGVERSRRNPGYKTISSRRFIEKILDARRRSRVRVSRMLAVNPKRAWAGLYEMSPDHHCILGPVDDVPGFFCANGFSGHGVMHAPSTGKILADLILYGRP